MTHAGLCVVIDSNVWISGMLSRSGSPAQVTRHVVSVGLPVFSEQTFAELKDRLWRPKFDRYVTMEQRKSLLTDLESISLWITVPAALAAQTFCRDPADDKFIQLALALLATGKAAPVYLVTGDQDLLVLADTLRQQGMAVVTPAEAMTLPEFSAQ